MKPHEKLITELVLETTQPFPITKRVEYLIALSRLTSSDSLAGDLDRLAKDLKEADTRQGQMLFALRNTPDA